MSKLFAPGATFNRNTDERIIARLSAESANTNTNEDVAESNFFESVTDEQFLESVSKAATQSLRTNAAAGVLTWIDEDDASFDELDAIIYGFASDHDGEELNDEELEDYNAMMGYAFEFIIASGADASQVQSMETDADAAEAVFKAVKEQTKGKDDSELVADFSVRETLMLEAKKKVVRDGKVVYIPKRTKKYRQTPAQKAALKKARSKANTAAAKANRRKSMRLRKARGMD